ncbi:uncharacterized protein LOC120627430 [Pararge aegeria]|uniref:uncharacterized protein LOC120627430 n=1 Tax=Pararge aegeria TaxID=116150 RepID=UPI0019D2EB1D|nr:uncharacterized protein LOC120627430 [Pararge aegeria]
MENVCIHVKFSPLMKKISKSKSKCCLEIVPLITYNENIDKIKWKQKIDKIEYIVPMNYKIIIKKLNPNENVIKMYYSCVDLLPSTLPNVNLDTGSIYRVISDTIVLNKEKNDCLAPTNMLPLDIKLNQRLDSILKSTNLSDSDESPSSLKLSDSIISNNMSEKFKTGSVQTEKDEAKENCLLRETINATYCSDKSTSTILQYINSKAVVYQKIEKNCPAYNNLKAINAKDNFRTNKQPNSIAGLFNELDILKYIHNTTTIENTRSPPYYLIQDVFDEEMVICNIRMKPQVRVAKFVEKMEKEIMPLKIILNNIISRCSSLGLHKNIGANNRSLDEPGLKREKNYNRVVYSMVFD